MSNQRRIQKRVSLDTTARLSVWQAGNIRADGDAETVIANLSGGGAFLQTRQQLPLATKVGLEFQVSIADVKRLKLLLSIDVLRSLKQERVLVQATGVVIRQEKDGVGVIFDANHQFTPMKAPVAQ